MGQRATSSRASVVFPAPLRPSISTTGLDAPSPRTASRMRVAAASSAAASGSGLPLECADDTAEGAPRDPHEGNRDSQQRDDVRLEPQVVALAHVPAERSRPASAAATAVADLVGAAAEPGPGQG